LALWASATAAKPTDGLGLDFTQALALIAWAKAITEGEAAKERTLKIYNALLTQDEANMIEVATMNDLGEWVQCCQCTRSSFSGVIP